MISEERGINVMATSSITQNIVIKDKKLSRRLISALENANNKKSVEITYSKKHREIRGDDIKKIFGSNES